MKTTLLSFAFCFVFSAAVAQNTSKDLDAVKAACMDYIHTFYHADTTLAYKSIHKSLRKTGFYFAEEENKYSEQLEMPFDQLISLAKRWNADGSRANENSPKEVTIFEVSDKTAVAKVSAVWGIDYISLMKIDGKWLIVNVLWQSPPKFSVSESK
ncbi:MAG: nuclear transport factor 2 family protein [Bacteroidota bacterium]